LIATIKSIRPDLLQDVCEEAPPISLTMPPHLQKATEFVEGIGEPINACFLTRNDVDFTGWFVLSILHSLFCQFSHVTMT
jgi:hypothetical protein